MAKSRRFEEDDDDDLPPRRPRRAENAGGNTAVKVVAIVGGILLVVFLTCAGLGYYACWSAKKAVNEAGDGFNKQLEKMAEEQKQRQKELENSDKNVSHRAAEAFLQELKGRRFDAAYDQTSVAYQRRVTREQFAEIIEPYREHISAGSPFPPDVFAPDYGTSYSYKRTFSVPRTGLVEMSVTMIKVGAGWKVDQFTIEPKR